MTNSLRGSINDRSPIHNQWSIFSSYLSLLSNRFWIKCNVSIFFTLMQSSNKNLKLKINLIIKILLGEEH